MDVIRHKKEHEKAIPIRLSSSILIFCLWFFLFLRLAWSPLLLLLQTSVFVAHFTIVGDMSNSSVSSLILGTLLRERQVTLGCALMLLSGPHTSAFFLSALQCPSLSDAAVFRTFVDSVLLHCAALQSLEIIWHCVNGLFHSHESFWNIIFLFHFLLQAEYDLTSHFFSLATVLPELSNLTNFILHISLRIALRQNSHPNNVAGSKALCAGLNRSRFKLEDLQLINVLLSKEEWEFFASFFSRQSESLKHLSVFSDVLDFNCWLAYVLPPLSTCSLLQSFQLKIRVNSTDDHTLYLALASVLPTLPNLSSLDLSSSFFGPALIP